CLQGVCQADLVWFFTPYFLKAPMSTILVPILCPFCGASGSVPDKSRGHNCLCPKCGKRFLVPKLSTPGINVAPSAPPIQQGVMKKPVDFDGQELPEAVPVEADDNSHKQPGEKFCIECGSTIRARASICPKCGVSQSDIAGRKSKHCHECGS